MINLKVAHQLTRFASRRRLASFDPATANKHMLRLEKKMEIDDWKKNIFPTHIQFAFDFSDLFRSAEGLREFLNDQKTQQRQLLINLRIKPEEAIYTNISHADEILKIIRDVSDDKVVGDELAMSKIREFANNYTPMKTAPFSLMKQNDYESIIAGGKMLCQKYGTQWIDKKYGWNITEADFDRNHLRLATRYLELDDILDNSRATVSNIKAEINGLQLTKERIADEEKSLVERLNILEDSIRKQYTDFATAMMDGKALESPGQNWREKEDTHNGNARRWFWASAVWIILVIVGGFCGTGWIAKRAVTTIGAGTVTAVATPAAQITMPTTPANGAGTAAAATTPALPGAQAVKALDKPEPPLDRERLDTPLAVVFITTYVLLAISIFRFMTRQYQLEQRLADDARQRRTMMNSYLALLEHKTNPISEAERILVLQVLFRGAALTESNDDISPVNLIDAFVTALKRDSK